MGSVLFLAVTSTARCFNPEDITLFQVLAKFAGPFGGNPLFYEDILSHFAGRSSRLTIGGYPPSFGKHCHLCIGEEFDLSDYPISPLKKPIPTRSPSHGVFSNQKGIGVP